jgi:hypothetical protein
MKPTKTKRTAPSLAKRQVGARELLEIAAELADQVLRADHSSSADLASWRERSLAALDDPDQNEGIIRACQIQRDAGALEADEAFFYINYFINGIAEDIYCTDAQLNRIGQAVEAAEKAHGLKDNEYWRKGEAPDDVENLQAAWNGRADAIIADFFRKHGEADMANLLLGDRASFMDRIKNGRRQMASKGTNPWRSRVPGPAGPRPTRQEQNGFQKH